MSEGSIESRFRRAIPRQPAEWIGSYRFESDPDDRPRRCRVLDISTAGAGVQLFDTSIDEAAHRLLVVSVELRGETRHVGPWEGDTVRASIEFPELVGTAAEYVRSLRSLGSRARW